MTNKQDINAGIVRGMKKATIAAAVGGALVGSGNATATKPMTDEEIFAKAVGWHMAPENPDGTRFHELNEAKVRSLIALSRQQGREEEKNKLIGITSDKFADMAMGDVAKEAFERGRQQGREEGATEQGRANYWHEVGKQAGREEKHKLEAQAIDELKQRANRIASLQKRVKELENAMTKAVDELEKWNELGKNIIGSECRYSDVAKIINKLRISAGESK